MMSRWHEWARFFIKWCIYCIRKGEANIEQRDNSSALFRVHMQIKRVYEFLILYEGRQCYGPHFIVGKTEAWRDEMAHLSICTSSSDPFFQDPRFHAYLQCCSVSQLRKFIKKNFLKSMWWMKMGYRVNKSQAFPLYFNHIQLPMPRSDSGDPVQGVDVSFMTLPFWWTSTLSFFPHLVISGEEQVLDSGCHYIFPGGQCFAAAMWGDWTSDLGSVLGLHPP